jgi:hypothetical protein
MKEIINNQSVIYLLAVSPSGIYVFTFAKLTRFKENLYEMYGTGCHQIPGSSIATLTPFTQP